jgi:DNA gyrase subunit B
MQEYSKGVPQYALKEVGTSEDRGTLVTFTPDDSIFIETTYQYGILEARMRELAFLNKGISITLTDERDGRKKTAVSRAITSILRAV